MNETQRIMVKPEVVRALSMAISKEMSQYCQNINKLHVKAGDGILRIVATDKIHIIIFKHIIANTIEFEGVISINDFKIIIGRPSKKRHVFDIWELKDGMRLNAEYIPFESIFNGHVFDKKILKINENRIITLEKSGLSFDTMKMLHVLGKYNIHDAYVYLSDKRGTGLVKCDVDCLSSSITYCVTNIPDYGTN